MKLGFGPKYCLKCVLTDSVNNSILKKIDFSHNGPDRVTYNINMVFVSQWLQYEMTQLPMKSSMQ